MIASPDFVHVLGNTYRDLKLLERFMEFPNDENELLFAKSPYGAERARTSMVSIELLLTSL
jgi:hypothetical protein